MRFVLALALLATAQEPEHITVNANALVGVWKVTRPSYVAKRGIFGDFEFGPPSPGFCRIEQVQDELTVHCLAHGSGRVTLKDRTIRFACSMVARLVLEGVLQSDHSFTAHQAVSLAGMTALEDPNLSSGGKIDLSASPADQGDAAQKLRTAIAQDGKTESALGAIQTVLLLGHQEKFSPPDRPNIQDYFSVYAVEFDQGERICGLHLTGNGVLDAFECA